MTSWVSWSDATLRRLAVTGLVVQVAVVLGSIPVDLLADENEGTLGVQRRGRQILLDLVPLVFPVVGVLVLVRQPRALIGWVLVAVGAAWSLWVRARQLRRRRPGPGSGEPARCRIAAAVNEGTLGAVHRPDGCRPGPAVP